MWARVEALCPGLKLSAVPDIWRRRRRRKKKKTIFNRRKIPRHCLLLCTVCIVKYTQWKQKNVVLRLKMSKMLWNYHSWDIVFHICSTVVRSKIKILKIYKEHTQPSSTKVHKINVLVDGVTRFWIGIACDVTTILFAFVCYCFLISTTLLTWFTKLGI